MTLEEELKEKGFKINGPFTITELSNFVKTILPDKDKKPVYVHIIQGKIARSDTDEDERLYMICYAGAEELNSSNPAQKTF